jgi:hypothetical protein
MTATLDDEVAKLRRANAELQQRLDEALAERDEALEQQIASAEILGIINASPGDLAPVFDAMLEKAMRPCEAAFGGLWTFEGESTTSRRRCAAYPQLTPNFSPTKRSPSPVPALRPIAFSTESGV